ncbi:lamin tail domain-containing protein [Algoriphagus litoralis]|uniref:lamin tail domain-containing protein n=1 Tax=Algoriphagus litoralis TaxID=2202829 RepID=UPI000DB98BCD|nr:lamin tail domain-containing protein [Algoriphagus litoralis]
MQKHFLKKLAFISLFFLELGITESFSQRQDFEGDFQVSSNPEEFLPGWLGNDVRATSARIFQISNQGRNNSRALAVQPISSFDGKIWVRLNPSSFENPRVEFFAKTLQNGSGNRPVLVFYSWGEGLEGAFSEPIQIGENQEFSNETRDFKKYTIDLPEIYKTSEEAILSLEIRYGAGSGSSARWIMDDFEFGDIEIDETPPTVLAVKGYDSNSLLIQFSENVDPVFSILPLAYELDEVNPDEIQLKNDSVVVITLGQNLESAKSYNLIVRQIPDLEGNFLKDTTLNFTFFDPTDIPPKSLVINEIMPSPRADQDLPNVEYIELFHAGDTELRLGGVSLSNSRSTVVLNEYWINPGEYLILAPDNQASQFSDFGKVLAVANWPTLLNSGDEIVLNSADGSRIDQISYSTATWGESEFANGGYSLEVPNPFLLCENSLYLKPSSAEARGTPGSQNAVFDLTASLASPELISGYFRDSTTISLLFSVPFLQNLNLENVQISPVLKVDKVVYQSAVEVLFLLQSPADSNQIYLLQLNGLLDCFGNELDTQSIELVRPQSADLGNVIINEVLFNPKTGDPKFVEIRNTTQKHLDLAGFALANVNAAGEVDQLRVFGSQGKILSPESYLAITTDVNALRLSYPKSAEKNLIQIPSLPSYPIGGGTVVLVNPTGEVVESFDYDEDLHHPLLRDPKGVSLERISSDSPASVRSNWQSASGNEDYATPGKRNSQNLESEFESELIQLDPEIFDPEGSAGATFTTIRYELGEPGWVGTFKIYSAAGQLIQTLSQNQILGTEGLLTWTGTDSTGKLVRAGYFVLVAELYEPSGGLKVIKRTIVVATRL